MNIRQWQSKIFFFRQIQTKEQFIQCNKFNMLPASSGIMSSFRPFADSAFVPASKRYENIALRRYARIRTSRIHDPLNEMIDLRLLRLFDHHRHGNAFSRKNLRSLCLGLHFFQEGLEHRSIRMDIRTENLEIFCFLVK